MLRDRAEKPIFNSIMTSAETVASGGELVSMNPLFKRAGSWTDLTHVNGWERETHASSLSSLDKRIFEGKDPLHKFCVMYLMPNSL